jgi:hypothetical protein
MKKLLTALALSATITSTVTDFTGPFNLSFPLSVWGRWA